MAEFIGDVSIGAGGGSTGVTSWSAASVSGAAAGDLILLCFFGSYAFTGTGVFSGPGAGWTLQCDLVNKFRAPSTGGYWGRLVVWSRLATADNLGATSGSITGTGYTGGFNEWGVQAAVFRRTVFNVPAFVGNTATDASTADVGSTPDPLTLPANVPGRTALACVITMQTLGTPTGWTTEGLAPTGNTLAVGGLHMKSVDAAGDTYSLANPTGNTHRAFVFNLADRRRGPAHHLGLRR